MRRRDKLHNIERANLLAEQRYLESKGLLNEFNKDRKPIQQIKDLKELPIGDFVNKFKSIATDTKVQGVLKRGQKDGNPGDDKISYESTDIPVSKLKPTQNEIGMDESLKNILTDKYGSLGSFLQGSADVGPNPLVTYNGQYIIDGHHRWSQVFAANPKATVPCMNLKGSLGPMDILKIVHMSIAVGAKKLPLSSAQGTNLLKVDSQSVMDYVKTNMTETAFKVWQQAGNENIEAVQKLITGNVGAMQKNGVADGAPPRTAMPQTDAAEKTTAVIDRVAGGQIDFNKPGHQFGGDGGA